MNTKREMQQGAIKYLIMLLQRIIGIALFFLGSGMASDIRSPLNLSLYAAKVKFRLIPFI